MVIPGKLRREINKENVTLMGMEVLAEYLLAVAFKPTDPVIMGLGFVLRK